MNQQVKSLTEQTPKATVTPPEITALGSQEIVAASIGEIFDDPTPALPSDEPISPVVPIKETIPQPEQKIEIPPTQTVEEEAPAPALTTETAARDLLTNPLEPVIEQPLSVIPNTATVEAEHRAVQAMLKNDEFVGAEGVVVDNRTKDT